MAPQPTGQTPQGELAPEIEQPSEMDQHPTRSKMFNSSTSSTGKPQIHIDVEELEKGDGGNAPPEGEITPIRSPLAARIFRGPLEDSFFEYWWGEIVVCIIMVLALIAIILILALHENHTLPSWPFSITLNSMISIMVVVLKATMLAILASGLGQLKWLWFEKPRPLSHYNVYDKAGQGPRFASQLLWVLRGKQMIACIGLAVIIAAVALDPFSQQVIQYYVTTKPSLTQKATIPRTTFYDVVGPSAGEGWSPLDHAMQGAITAGFYTPNSDAFIVEADNCLTGNCSFPVPYRTVGMCHTCYEVTEFVEGECSFSSAISNDTGLQTWICNYSLPSGTKLVQSLVADSSEPVNFEWMNGVSGPFNPLGPSPPAPSGPAPFFGWETIFSTQINNSNCTTCHNSTCQGATCGVSAMQCYFQPCINTYTATVSKGSVTEHLVESAPLSYEGNDTQSCWTSLAKDCLSKQDWTVLNGLGINATTYENTEYIPFCPFHEYPEVSPGDTVPVINSACVYAFYLLTYNVFMGFFGTFLNGTLAAASPLKIVGDAPDLTFIYNYGEITVDSVNTTFANVAKTISTQMRVAGNINYSTPVQGEILEIITLIRIDWAWLSLPVALVVLTLVFIITVIIQTFINGRRPIGKIFSLGLLLTGVAGTVSDQFQDLKYLHEAATDLGAMKDSPPQVAQVAKEVRIQIKGEGTVKKLIRV